MYSTCMQVFPWYNGLDQEFPKVWCVQDEKCKKLSSYLQSYTPN